MRLGANPRKIPEFDAGVSKVACRVALVQLQDGPARLITLAALNGFTASP
jgi:hypothetical protein